MEQNRESGAQTGVGLAVKSKLVEPKTIQREAKRGRGKRCYSSNQRLQQKEGNRRWNRATDSAVIDVMHGNGKGKSWIL